jgi:hypothetical protein
MGMNFLSPYTYPVRTVIKDHRGCGCFPFGLPRAYLVLLNARLAGLDRRTGNSAVRSETALNNEGLVMQVPAKSFVTLRQV